MKTERLHKEFAAARATLDEAEALIDKLPELVDASSYTIISIHEVAITLGLSLDYIPANFKPNRETMEAAGWKKNVDLQWKDDGTYGEFYAQGKVMVNLYYRPNRPGSTCKINVIGYEQRPIVEVTCLEA